MEEVEMMQTMAAHEAKEDVHFDRRNQDKQVQIDKLKAELSSSLARNTQLDDQITALTLDVNQYMIEINRLNSCLLWEQNRQERIGTHNDDCHTWGPGHYECLLKKYKELLSVRPQWQD